ncbi:MAG: alanine racemase, partial [bacterium]
MDLTKRPTCAIVHLDRLRHNANELLAMLKPEQEMMAIIKANAYGHGAVFVARCLETCGIKKLGVATFTEGLELREQGSKAEIYVLNGIMGPLPEYFSNRLYPVIYEMDQLKTLCAYLNKEQREFNAILKFDTGMGRLGFTPAQVDAIAAELRRSDFLKISAIMTHLSKADEEDQAYTKRQFTLFKKLREILAERGLRDLPYSFCNSAAIIDQQIDDFNWVRPGIALYGCYPNQRQQESINLKPVLELKTKIISIKSMIRGSSVGYGATFTTERDSLIAILPVGYADGYPRLASNKGHVLVRGQKAPIVGRISMDLMAIDVTDIQATDIHDDAILIGQDGKEQIRAEDV